MARQVGINLMYWAETWTQPQPPLFARARAAGYDLVEVSLVNGGDFDVAGWRDTLAQHDLGVTCIMGIDAATDLGSPDASIRQAGIDYMRGAIAAAYRLGSRIICGLPYTRWNYFPDDCPAYRDRCAESMRFLARSAADHGITLCLEVINRYETCIFNTVLDALAFLDQVGHPAVKLHLDTYHMQMEEDDLPAAIWLAGERLGHFHCSDSNRKLPGRGLVDWRGVRAALDDIGYTGALVVETFPIPGTGVGRSINTWRRLVDDLDADAQAAAAFVRRHLA